MKLLLENVSKRYGTHQALDEVDLHVPNARCLTLIGPSGGGKSTTLRLIAGLEKASSGRILVNDTPVPQTENELHRYRKSIGVVFQSYNLFPHLDALANIALPLEKVHGVAKADAHDRAQALLAQFKLASHSRKKPSELSGGQNQRVAIARSLAHDPDLILFDEPTSALDPEMSAQILDVIEALIASGKDCVVVTHQMGFAKRASDYAAFISQGRVAASGPSPDLFDAPKKPELAQFLDRDLNY